MTDKTIIYENEQQIMYIKDTNYLYVEIKDGTYDKSNFLESIDYFKILVFINKKDYNIIKFLFLIM